MTTQRIPPPAWFAIALALIVVLHRYFPIASLVPTPWHYAGIGIASLGVVIAVWSVALFRHVRTTIIPFQESTALITWGPYRFTRNPMYLSMALFLLGAAAVSIGLVVIDSATVAVSFGERVKVAALVL